MDLRGLRRDTEYRWVIEPTGAMRVPAVLYADEGLLADMDEKVRQQIDVEMKVKGGLGIEGLDLKKLSTDELGQLQALLDKAQENTNGEGRA